MTDSARRDSHPAGSHGPTRRSFLRYVATAGLTAPVLLPSLVRAASANGKLRHASIGGSGMAWGDMNSFAASPNFELVAVVDVDERNFARVRETFGDDVKTYTDWRDLLHDHPDSIDSVNVTTPDHMHAPISLTAIRQGKHVYCQKPLSHTVHESRVLTKAAREAGVVTQMGIQVHSRMEYRLAAHFIQDGAIGKVTRVHTWSNKNWGGGERPDREDNVPDALHWDRWLGVAPERPFVENIYHPGQWRRWQDFGTGTFGDMGCHIYDPVYTALKLTAPKTVRSAGPGPNRETWPTSAEVHYVYPRTQYTSGDIAVTWYDGGRMPGDDVLGLLGDVNPPDQGSIFIGEAGVMLLPHVGAPQLLPRERFRDYPRPQLEPHNHYVQFIDACRGEDETSASFDYSGPLTEAILLGNVAARFPDETLQWNAAELRVANNRDANEHIRKTYRRGWEVEGLA